MSFILLLTSLFFVFKAGQDTSLTQLAGVYQGRSLFIQNSFDPVSKEFCVKKVTLNDRLLNVNYHISAIKIDFDRIDIHSPVTIKISHHNGCDPTIINPDAIFFHSIFSFQEIQVSDSLIYWRTVGEKGDGGQYTIEYIEGGLWTEQSVLDSQGKFEGAEYSYAPKVSIGSNKFRIKYIYPSGDFLYSRELDLHFYPDPVTFNPKVTDSKIVFSRSAYFQIYDAGSTEVLNGTGTEVDVSKLPRGEYVIYFDGDDPGMFTKK